MMNGEQPGEGTAEDVTTAFDSPTADEAEAMVSETLGAPETVEIVAAVDASESDEASDESNASSEEEAAAEPVAEATEPSPTIDAEIPTPPSEPETAGDSSGSDVEQPVDEVPVSVGAVLAADAIAASAPAPEPEVPAEPDTPVVVATELTWGFIDTEGRVHQKTTERFRGRVIGKIHGGSGEPQIAEFESNFGPLVKEVELLEKDVSEAKNKVAVLGRVRKMKTTAGRSEALGDFDDLFARLLTLETTVQTEIDERRAAKEALITRAEEMKDSTDWKVTGEAYKALFLEWKEVGASGREADDALWARFIAARESFNTRRSEHFNQRQEQWEENRLLKQDLIVRAHELSTSDQWRQTSDALRSLFDEWKKIGSAGRQSDEELWQQFRGAQQHFYDRRAATWEDGRKLKEALCQRAEDLRESTDWEATVEEMKGMMAEWKTVGTTGKRDVDDALWNRFRAAQNAFFDKRYAEASAREQEERSKLQRKDEITTSIEALAYSSDPVAAAEEAAVLRAEFDTLPPLRKDKDEALQRRIRKAMGDIRVNAAAEGARRAVSWQGKLREALERSQDQIESLQQTVVNQESTLADVRSQLASASADDTAALEQQVQELNESISYNKAEIDRLQGSMSEIQGSVEV
ncbi:MAG: DUF349 domain-containing protein [Thermomicrobiales bacterium]|nr:DUF349 domain-containing protein [Thermomicrobiales bacterium]